jgi:hypothetical protein
MGIVVIWELIPEETFIYYFPSGVPPGIEKSLFSMAGKYLGAHGETEEEIDAMVGVSKWLETQERFKVSAMFETKGPVKVVLTGQMM